MFLGISSESESLVPAWLKNLGISSRWLKEASRNLIPFWFFIGIWKKGSKKLSPWNIFLSNLGHVAEKVVTDVEVGGEAELVEGFRVDVLHTWDGGLVDDIDVTFIPGMVNWWMVNGG